VDLGSYFSQDGIRAFASATITNSPIIKIKENFLQANFDEKLLSTQARLPTCSNSSSSGYTSLPQIYHEGEQKKNYGNGLIYDNFVGDVLNGACEDMDREFSCSDDDNSPSYLNTPVLLH